MGSKTSLTSGLFVVPLDILLCKGNLRQVMVCYTETSGTRQKDPLWNLFFLVGDGIYLLSH